MKWFTELHSKLKDDLSARFASTSLNWEHVSIDKIIQNYTVIQFDGRIRNLIAVTFRYHDKTEYWLDEEIPTLPIDDSVRELKQMLRNG